MLEGLNEKQVEAVKCVEGPVMVFAGAGTGKTRTLTHRIAYMINEIGIKPYNICAITFTNKATNEMRNRLDDLVGPTSRSITISTFHALCAKILRQDISHLNYSKDFEIIDDEDQLKIIKEVLEENNFNKKEFTPKHMKKVINTCKCFGIKSEYETENRIVELYEKHMKELNLLDFEDLLIKTYELLYSFPEVLEKYQNKYKYVLVDEFQDTNIIQYKIAKALTIKSRNLFVVGDDDQSIYSFRGTNYENIRLFQKDFTETKKFFLTENYRSTQKILEGANKLIANNVDREKKELFSAVKGCSDDVIVYTAMDENDEADYVVGNILNLIRKGVDHKQIAVLYRNNVLSRNFELSLIRCKIPYKVYGGMSYLRRREIKDIIAYLKLITNNNDVFSFNRVINVPGRGLGPSTINKVLELKKKYRLTLFEAIDASKTILTLSKYNALVQFKNMIITLGLLLDDDSYTLVDIFNSLLSETKYESIYDDDEDKDERLENIAEFKSVLMKIENNGEIATKREKLVSAFDEAVLSDDKLQSQKESNDGVTLSTIHSAKGLEFDYVFVVALEEGLFPSAYRVESDEDIEEERRVCYVAVTRAKKKLFLTHSQRRMIYGQTQRSMKSRFLVEYLELDKKKPLKKEEPKPSKVFEKNKTAYTVGESVIHDTYGEGIVISIDGEMGQICFTKKGVIKKFIMSHPSIHKA